MNLIHVGKFYPPYRGGMESYLMDLAEAQVRQGHKVTVIVHNHDWQTLFSPTTSEFINGVRLIRVKTLRPVLHTPLMFGLNRQLKKLMKTQSIDLIHLHSPNPSLFALLLSKTIKKIPWVLSWHSDMVTQHSSWLLKLIYRIIKPLENSLINNSQKILVSSQYYADASPQLSVNQQKLKVIPLGINTVLLESNRDTQTVNEASQLWNISQFRLFSLGRLTFYKNQGMLIRAMKQLEQCQLLLAGGGQLATVLQTQINDSELTERVKLLGAVSWQLAHQLFASCEVFCLASHDRAESFGVVLLEAMYHNKIILVADTEGSGMKWLAERYNKGFTFKADDVNDFVKQLRHIQENYAEIVARSPQFDYHIDAIAHSVEQSYHSIN